jgi:hypothetical protein
MAGYDDGRYPRHHPHLKAAHVRYLIADGLAVVTHGYVRFTADMDLMLAMDNANLAAAVHALGRMEYRPRAPVAIEQLLDASARQTWVREKNLKVFSLYSPRYPATEVDVFLELPLNFEDAYSRAVEVDIGSGIPARMCGLDDLIEMKLRAGRPRDIEDVRQLRALWSEGP